MSLDDFMIGFVEDIVNEAASLAANPRRRAQWRVDPWDLSENQFKKNFRFSKELTVELMNIVEPLLQEKNIDTRTKVLCSLNFLGTGSYQTPVGNNYIINLSQASVSRCLHDVIEALNHQSIFGTWVRFPEDFQEMNRIAREFYTSYGFPGVIGCIDCTHVAIVPPAATQYDERSYINRKNYHSINTQLICDSNLKILNVNSLFPGSTHDCHIWNSSRVLTLLESIYERGHRNYHLLGDSGYALRPWCLTPLSSPEDGTPEYAYNEALVKARSTIERCNGVLKARFRCLLKDRVLHYAPNKATKIINACTVLHNMCVARNLGDDEQEMYDRDLLGFVPSMPHEERGGGRRTNMLLQIARAKQNSIVRNYFT